MVDFAATVSLIAYCDCCVPRGPLFEVSNSRERMTHPVSVTGR
jgi:hypothetical protein